AEAAELLEARQPEAGSPDQQSHQAGRDQRGLCQAQGRRRAPPADRFRRREVAGWRDLVGSAALRLASQPRVWRELVGSAALRLASQPRIWRDLAGSAALRPATS